MERDRINKIFEECDNMDPKEAIQRAVSLGCSYNTAKKYYYLWRKHYMGDDKKQQDKDIGTKKEVKISPKLNIKNITIQGSNGIYTVCKDGIELKNKDHTLAFTCKEDWEDFKAEIDKVFAFKNNIK